MALRRNCFLLLFLCFACAAGAQAPSPSKELIYIDSAGVLRWRTSNVEVAMFGANYCLPSASDYRAAGKVSTDRKKMIDDDMTHFVRMGWDALRLSFWGDWECCDREGNLIANDHLDLLDYLIFQAKRRDLHMLLSPIITYSSMWPDGDDPAAVGFSRYYKKEELGTNPAAIAAQVNYLKQLLNHVNPYTGIALKDEPYICYLELINEPFQHPEDFAGSVGYINALNDAVRQTGCQKITFFNLSQDFRMAGPIAASKADGVSFAWYPSGLVSGHQQRGNFLRTVDSYAPMTADVAAGKPRLVYEFDMPDVMSGYHYPAMVRAFRSAGAQSAAMFTYDMLATAPYNLGWQTHCLNMVYTPQKAVSAIIASQVMRRIPRMRDFGPYPGNTRFGDFRVSYEENLSELVSSDLFYYSNTTASRPPSPATLKRIVGFGSSPLVAYEGAGLYFLDKISDGVWRLEVYPDSLQVDDPFAPTRLDRLVFQLIAREWPMGISLPDLGGSFSVEPLNAGNTYAASARNGSFAVRPGVYLLTAHGKSASPLPDRLPGVPYYLGMREFVCPAPPHAPTAVVLHAPAESPANADLRIAATVAADAPPDSVTLRIAGAAPLAMRHVKGYDYAAEIAAGTLPAGAVQFAVDVSTSGRTLSFPKDSPVAASRAESYSLRVVSPDAPVTLFDPARDLPMLSYSRSADWHHRAAAATAGSGPGKPAVQFGFPGSQMADDFTSSLYIGSAIADRAAAIHEMRLLHVKLKAAGSASVMRLTLVEKDGAAWSTRIEAGSSWQEKVIPLSSLESAKSVMLPQGYPGNWSYRLSPPAGRTSPEWENVERLQFSLRKGDFDSTANTDASRASLMVEGVWLSN